MSKKKIALDIINEKKDNLCILSDLIWDNPETAFCEYFAEKNYCSFLEQEGFRIEQRLAGIDTAFSASFGSGKPVIGILGEFDALMGMSQQAEVTEKKAIEEGKAGHGCGHNLLGVGSLAAALAIKKYIMDNSVKGTVRFYGCPGEEGGSGKSFMAREGVFDDLDIALSWHPSDLNSVQNDSTLANYQIYYRFYGISSHAGIAPELGRSALDAVELLNIGVQFLREHIISESRIHYAITNSGGSSPGIVQPFGEVLYLIRAPKINQVEEIYQRINKIARGAALMTETELEIEFVKACSNIVCNTTLSKLMYKNFEEIGIVIYDEEDRSLADAMRKTIKNKDEYFAFMVNQVEDINSKKELLKNIDSPIHDVLIPYISKEGVSPASSDVGDVSQICPTAQISVVTMPAGTVMHSWQQVSVGKSHMAKKGMLQAGKIIAATAIDLLENVEIIEQAKDEFNYRTEGKVYKSPIPKNVFPKIIHKSTV